MSSKEGSQKPANPLWWDTKNGLVKLAQNEQGEPTFVPIDEEVATKMLDNLVNSRLGEPGQTKE
ncbi:hypothetical protein ACFL0Y_03270 [Patescibacteria group bacterium]